MKVRKFLSEVCMARTVAIGIQDFAQIVENKYFYIDKTGFIKEWWESGDNATLITRPRRFGKTLNLNMLDYFLSIKHANRGDLFESLSIWKEEKYRQLQGTYPVISLSFARVKANNYTTARENICEILTNLYIEHYFLRDSEVLTDKDREYFDRISMDMRDSDATTALHQLSDFLYRYYRKKVIILVDEYDTPMQEAYVYGYWDEMVTFTRSLFNSTFKTNPYLEKALMTGITRVSKESMFSDLNNLEVVTITSDKYATSFGFTEQEVMAALEEYLLENEFEDVKYWYDGFTFGNCSDIYNPWSILNYLSKRKLENYWVNTSSNSLAGKLIQEGNKSIKLSFETLLEGGTIHCPIDEQIVFNQLDDNETAIWSLLLASGYLKVLSREDPRFVEDPMYDLCLTNREVQRMFRNMVRGWFKRSAGDYNDFIKSLLQDDLEAMNAYMNRVAFRTFSYFDTGNSILGEETERFYHGFVLGLIVDLGKEYIITSNRESGFGRYDVILEAKDKQKDSFIFEFKVHNKKKENTLEDTVVAALQQIEDKQYEADLIIRGVSKERIRKYGFAFEGKTVLIGQ